VQAVAGKLEHTGVGRALLDELEPAHDGGQHVVEIVRDAAGETAQRLHFLALRQRRHRRLAPLHFDVQRGRGFLQRAGALGHLMFQLGAIGFQRLARRH
jgi:hypothetical protein